MVEDSNNSFETNKLTEKMVEYAVNGQNFHELTKMIENGEDDFVNKYLNGKTKKIMASACDRGRTDIIKLLIEKGADANDCNLGVLLGKWQDIKFANYLFENGYTASEDKLYKALRYVAYYGHIDSAEFLFNKGLSRNIRKFESENLSSDMSPAIFLAVKNGYSNFAKYLLDNDKSEYNENFDNYEFCKNVMAEEYSSGEEIAKLFIDKCYNNEPKKDGCGKGMYNYLTSAVECQNDNIVYYINNRNYFNFKNNEYGSKFLEMAIKNGRKGITKLLVNKCVRLDKTSSSILRDVINDCKDECGSCDVSDVMDKMDCIVDCLEIYENKFNQNPSEDRNR